MRKNLVDGLWKIIESCTEKYGNVALDPAFYQAKIACRTFIREVTGDKQPLVFIHGPRDIHFWFEGELIKI